MKLITKIALTTATALAFTACDQVQQGFDEGYNKGLKDECVKSSTAQGVPDALAGKICDCAVEKVGEQFSGMEKLNPPSDELMKIGEQCAREVAEKEGMMGGK